MRKWRSYNEARKFTRSLGLKKQKDWQQYCKSGKKPADIPANPRRDYKKQWISWLDFLGTSYVANQKRNYRTFEEARKFAHSLKPKLKNKDEWFAFTKSGKLPDDIPADVAEVYEKHGTWTTWGNFLGTGRIQNQEKRKRLLSAKEARIEIKKIAKEVFGGKPFGPNDWYKAHEEGKIPKNLPKHLDDIYNPNSRDNRRRKKK